jgi:hypothetical protein
MPPTNTYTYSSTRMAPMRGTISPCRYHIPLLPLRLRMPAAHHGVSHLPRGIRMRRDCHLPLSTLLVYAIGQY